MTRLAAASMPASEPGRELLVADVAAGDAGHEFVGRVVQSSSGGPDGRGEEACEHLHHTVVALLGGLEQPPGGSVRELVHSATYALLDQRAEVVRNAAGRLVDLAL